MKCKRCGKTKEAHFDGHCEYGPYKFEPSEPEAAPSVCPLGKCDGSGFIQVRGDGLASYDSSIACYCKKVTELVADNGPRVDTRMVPPAHYFCAECGKTTEPCHHFSAQAVDTGTVPPSVHPAPGVACSCPLCCPIKYALNAALQDLPENTSRDVCGATTQATEARPELKEGSMKLDAKFYGEIIKVKDQSVVPDDEYVVFLAKDNAFAAILPEYRAKCVELGCDTQQIEAVDRMIFRLNTWRTNHPERLKNPDAKGERLLG